MKLSLFKIQKTTWSMSIHILTIQTIIHTAHHRLVLVNMLLYPANMVQESTPLSVFNGCFSNSADTLWIYWRCACGILIELRPFKLSQFFFFFFFFFLLCRYAVCVIKFSYSFQWMFLKLCRHTVDILKICMWSFDGTGINSDRMTAFQT